MDGFEPLINQRKYLPDGWSWARDREKKDRTRKVTLIWALHMVTQEAQLSQRDRATLRVIECFAKSFKITHVIRNDTAA